MIERGPMGKIISIYNHFIILHEKKKYSHLSVKIRNGDVIDKEAIGTQTNSFQSKVGKVDFKIELKEMKHKQLMKHFEKVRGFLLRLIKIFNWKAILDLKNSQDHINKVFVFLSKHIGTYKASIQELVEGQREVIYNDNFKFEDGQTAKEKTDEFEQKFKENFAIKEVINSKFKH